MKTMKDTVYSKPVMCLGCHIVSKFAKTKSGWTCPACGKDYPERYWRIQAADRVKSAIVVAGSDVCTPAEQLDAAETAMRIVRDAS